MLSILNRRSWLKHLFPPRRPALRVEALEDRTVPTAVATLTGIPNWSSQGPSTIQFGNNVEGLDSQNNPQIGAVESIAVDPLNQNRVFIATVNGGVWETTDANSGNPVWTPLTDQQASLATSSIAFAPLNVDPTDNTLFAGTGNLSADGGSVAGGGGAGGGSVGLLRTTDGGKTWTPLTFLTGFQIRDVIPTSVQANGTPATSVNNEVVLVGTLNQGGLWRSTDGGVTFSPINLPGSLFGFFGTVDKLIADPSDPTGKSFFASVQGVGVEHSTDGGATWNLVAGNGTLGVGSNDRVEIAASAAGGGAGSLFVAVIDTTSAPPPPGTNTPSGFGTVRSFWHSTTGGTTFTQMDNPRAADGWGLFAGNQGALDFSMAADPNDPNIVYVGGDNQPTAPDATIGTATFSGRHFIGDAAAAVSGTPASNTAGASAQWTPMEGNFASGTAPHPDSRAMVIVPDPTFPFVTDILEADDGGIYRVFDAPSEFGLRTWDSANGNLADSEVLSVAYDALNHEIIAGTQSNGSPEQNNPGDTVYTNGNAADVVGDTGTVTAVDNSNPAFSIRYTSTPFLGLQSQEFNAAGAAIGPPTFPALKVGNTPLALQKFDPAVLFDNPYVLDNVPDPLHGKRLLIGTGDALYESANGGNTLTLPLHTSTALGSVNGLDYGGVSGGVSNQFVILAGTTNGLFVRNGTTPSGTVREVFAGDVTAVQFDPTDWHTAYFTADGSVFMATNLNTATPTITDITGNLGTLTNTFQLDTIQVFKNGPSTEVAVGGFGGVFRATPAAGATTWTMYGINLPHVLVTQLVYSARDNTLLAGTLGRGVYEIAGATTTVFAPGLLNIRDSYTSNVRLVVDMTNPSLLDVFLDNPGPTPNLQVPLSTLSAIYVGGLGTSNSLTVNSCADTQPENVTVTAMSVTGLLYSGNGFGRTTIPVNYDITNRNLASLTLIGGAGQTGGSGSGSGSGGEFVTQPLVRGSGSGSGSGTFSGSSSSSNSVGAQGIRPQQAGTGNTITVVSTSAGATTITAGCGPGVNTVDVTGLNHDLNGLVGILTINAGPSGADSITFDDSLGTAGDHLSLTATLLASRGDPAGINYAGFAAITVDTPNAGHGIITVLGAPAFTPVTFNLGGSANSVSVNVTASSGYLLQLNSSSASAGNKLNAVNVTGLATVHRLLPTELEFLYPLVPPFFTSLINWNFGFSSVTTTPGAT